MNKSSSAFLVFALVLGVFIVLIFLSNLSDSSFIIKNTKTEEEKGSLVKDSRYEIKSAKVDYIYGGFQSGYATLYFDNYGEKEVMILNTQMNSSSGESWENNTLRIISDGVLYKLNLDEEVVFREKLEEFQLASMESGLKQKGAIILGSENILGRQADIWEITYSDGVERRWIWNSILLKLETENDIGEISTITAQNIEEGVFIPKEILETLEA